MLKLNLKIALRNLWKNKGISAINIGGLSVALAAFILITLYVTHENTYDKENPNYDRIYLVGRNLPDYKSDYTSPPLTKLIAQKCVEVELVGKVKKSSMEFALLSDSGHVFVKNVLAIDYNAAKILGIKPNNGLQLPAGDVERLMYVKDEHLKTLFPNKKDDKQETIIFGNRQGTSGIISGTITPSQHSVIQYDALSVAKELGQNENFGYPNYQTYVLVKEGTDINALARKIDAIYKEGSIQAGAEFSADEQKRQIIYLDRLADLHLKPAAGNDHAYQVMIVLFVLGLLILLIACINFTNLSIAQANSRAKEVGVKKVMGVYRTTLTIQFLSEIFIQCLLSTLLALAVAELLLPWFNNLFNVALSLKAVAGTLAWQLPLILCVISFIAGIYPALVLSGFKPAVVLKGNFQTSVQARWLRQGLLAVQFTVAIVFIAGLLIIGGQVNYMRNTDVGFKPEQVVKIKNLAIYNNPKDFQQFRERVLKIEGVKTATVSSDVPGVGDGGLNGYSVDGTRHSINFIDVDYDYFETLDIKLHSGRLFSSKFATDTANAAILNETALAKYGLTNPIGKTISGCGIDYTIVGVIKDVKAQGFDHAVEPTIYAMKNPCGNYRTSVLIKADEDKMAGVIAALEKNWLTLNPKDGEFFRYEFMDELYGRLFVKQAQLQSVFFAAAMLTIFIAVLGLFAFARFITLNRRKEISVRKILGANNLQILTLLNSSFLRIVVIANIVSWPIAYIAAKKWLETFAYSTEITIVPFIIAGAATILLTLVTVSVQAAKTIREKPVEALKYE